MIEAGRSVYQNMTLLLALSLACAPVRHILFIGNSHTQYNDVPGMVAELLRPESGWHGVQIHLVGVALLNDAAESAQFNKILSSGQLTHAVLQGATVSSSHKYTYPQDGGIAVAKRLRDLGVQVFLVSEWPRRGWDETAYIEDVYKGMAKATGSTVVPVGRVWDAVRKDRQGVDLWQGDGNHASPQGSYLSARTIARWLNSKPLQSATEGIDPALTQSVDQAASRLLDGK